LSRSSPGCWGEDLDQQNRIGECYLSNHQRRAGHRQIRNSDIMLGQKPRNDPRIGNHLAASCFIAQMIANESAQFVLKETMDRARRRHSARLAIDKFIPAPIVRIPLKELADGHPNRNFGQHNHAVLITRIIPQDSTGRSRCGAGLRLEWRKLPIFGIPPPAGRSLQWQSLRQLRACRRSSLTIKCRRILIGPSTGSRRVAEMLPGH
jgi:hypothetical protein